MMEDVRKTFQDHKHILHFMDIVHFMHMVKEKNEGLLDDQMIRRGRSRAKAPRYTTRPSNLYLCHLSVTPNTSLTTQMLK